MGNFMTDNHADCTIRNGSIEKQNRLNFIIITWQDMQLKYNFDNENRKTYLMQHTGVFRIL